MNGEFEFESKHDLSYVCRLQHGNLIGLNLKTTTKRGAEISFILDNICFR
jgi:hypothetical protein